MANHTNIFRITIWRAQAPLTGAAGAPMLRRCVECHDDLPLPFFGMDIDVPGKRIAQRGVCSVRCASSYIAATRAYHDGWELELAGEAPAYDLHGQGSAAPGSEAAEAVTRLAALAGVPAGECLGRVSIKSKSWGLDLAGTADRIATAIELGLEPEW